MFKDNIGIIESCAVPLYIIYIVKLKFFSVSIVLWKHGTPDAFIPEDPLIKNKYGNYQGISRLNLG